jgi:hypothetical protein
MRGRVGATKIPLLAELEMRTGVKAAPGVSQRDIPKIARRFNAGKIAA